MIYFGFQKLLFCTLLDTCTLHNELQGQDGIWRLGYFVEGAEKNIYSFVKMLIIMDGS